MHKRHSRGTKAIEPNIVKPKDHEGIRWMIQQSLDESIMNGGSKNNIIDIEIADEDTGQRILVITERDLMPDQIGDMCMNLSMAYLNGRFNSKEVESEFFKPDVESVLNEWWGPRRAHL